MIQYLIQLHKNLFLWMHHLSLDHPEYRKIIYIIAEKLDTYVLILAFILFVYFIFSSMRQLSWKKFTLSIQEGIQIFLSVLIAWGISYLIKVSVRAPRPYLRFPNEVVKLFPYGGFDSFPSGHATLFMALGIMMSFYHRHLGYLFIFFALIIAIARVIAGVHFPIDIIAGWIIGGGVSFLIYRSLQKIKK